ncbi:MAG: A/G-specific adenine glycosylase [Bdellovibrionales bacterium]
MKKSVALKKGKVKKGSGPGVRGSEKSLSRASNPDPLALLRWYDRHRRVLPWRALPGIAPDPYAVWLSEIMLQQTTVGTVGPYYQKFLSRWPTVAHLAKAPRGEVLKMWAGLGYYRRAHLLHDCAKRIVKNYGGQFPRTEGELLALPGFGPYTAAAVAAIAFDRRANVVDGNVERVIARVDAIRTPLPQAKPEIRAAAARVLPDARFGDYAQALMDLGATICTPRNPKCGLCPLAQACRARAMGIEEELPRRVKAKTRPVRRAMAFVAVNDKNEIFLRRRPQGGLLGGMMEIPSSEWCQAAAPELSQVMKAAPIPARWHVLPGSIVHVFSHFALEMQVALARAGNMRAGGRWVALQKLDKEALPSVMRKIVQHARDAL